MKSGMILQLRNCRVFFPLVYKFFNIVMSALQHSTPPTLQSSVINMPFFFGSQVALLLLVFFMCNLNKPNHKTTTTAFDR